MASPAMRATFPLLVMLSRQDRAAVSIERAATRTVSSAAVSTLPSVMDAAMASLPQ
jgi:hypothetical protein